MIPVYVHLPQTSMHPPTRSLQRIQFLNCLQCHVSASTLSMETPAMTVSQAFICCPCRRDRLWLSARRQHKYLAHLPDIATSFLWLSALCANAVTKRRRGATRSLAAPFETCASVDDKSDRADTGPCTQTGMTLWRKIRGTSRAALRHPTYARLVHRNSMFLPPT